MLQLKCKKCGKISYSACSQVKCECGARYVVIPDDQTEKYKSKHQQAKASNN